MIELFSNSYSQLLKHFHSDIAKNLTEELQHELLDELDLQSRWFSGLFGSEFVTTDGRSVSIKQFGFWNRSAGPDFLHCCIEIDGEQKIGPIELDLSLSHWFQHGHDTDPAFDETVLHVVFASGLREQFTRTQSNKHVPCVVVKEESLVSALRTKSYKSLAALPGMCARPLAGLNHEQIEKVLHEVLMHRYGQKATRSKLLSSIHGVQQARWIQLAETLGYKNNSFAFKCLAQRITATELSKNTPETILAILFGASGFLQPKLHEKAPADSQDWIENLWELWWQIRQNFEFSVNRTVQWKLSGVRPVNHPQRRLAALAAIARDWGRISQLNDWGRLKKCLLELENPFWNYHYTLTSKATDRKMQLIGESRVDDFFVNYLVTYLDPIERKSFRPEKKKCHQSPPHLNQNKYVLVHKI